MRQRFLIFFALIFLVILLVGLNAASYTQKQKIPDSELLPNRSTYNPGTTGTQALYTLLSETGRKVVRWQEPPAGLKTSGKNKPSVFVVVGMTKREFTEAEAVDLYQWVDEGGRLVIIDREPPEVMIRNTQQWKISLAPAVGDDLYRIDPLDQAQLIAGVAAAKPLQPTPLVNQVNAVQPSRFSSSISFERVEPTYAPGEGSGARTPPPPAPPRAAPPGTPVRFVGRPPVAEDPEIEEDYYEDEEPPPPSNKTYQAPDNRAPRDPQKFTIKGDRNAPPSNKTYGKPEMEADPESRAPANTQKLTIKGERNAPPVETHGPVAQDAAFASLAPVAHLANNDKTVLVDVAYGAGRIVFLSDPYIVSNAGVSVVDNAQLAINVLGSQNGIIAFDEYHQGFGSDSNRLFQYFAGTPVIAIFVQCAILAGFIFFSQSRRFARPVPEPEPNRLSKLEYVSAMAELQARTKAFDLAIENIYTDFRRRTARLLGVDNYTTTRKEMSVLIAERTKLDPNDVEDVMFQCEDIMHGEPANKKTVLLLIGRLRAIEEKLGLKRAGRTKI
jgi:hypothetical protein